MLLLDYQNVLIESILKDRFAPEYASSQCYTTTRLPVHIH
jgi:hypothetical protein